MMKLKRLLKDIPSLQVKGYKDVTLTGICSNSKLVSPGNLFVARKGMSSDGASYIPEAVSAGASAVVTDLYDPTMKGVVQIIHPDPSTIEAALAAEYYQFPSEELFMVGLTGTNGKTTTAFLVKALLDHFQGPCGLIGTIEYIVGQHRYQASRTTPDVTTNHKLLREMVSQGCRSAVMEVTSHALDQGRVDHIDFDTAIFSNLTQDHLDYHHTMDQYCEAKNRLFRELGSYPKKRKAYPKVALLNVDSPWVKAVADGCQASILTYGIENPADLKASHISLGGHGTKLDVTYQGKTLACQLPLVGRFNVYNALAAMGVVLARGFDFRAVIAQMEKLPSVRGRLEPVTNSLGLKIYVDFAHSDDALCKVLETLTELKKGRIITVFGCGGDRDKDKRPKMAAASERYSDLTIVTLDNPRTEDPNGICQAILKGFKRRDSYIVELDRRLAIQKAIEMASENDIILIAGKGHETSQIFAHKTIEFDDCKVAAEICSEINKNHKNVK